MTSEELEMNEWERAFNPYSFSQNMDTSFKSPSVTMLPWDPNIRIPWTVSPSTPFSNWTYRPFTTEIDPIANDFFLNSRKKSVTIKQEEFIMESEVSKESFQNCLENTEQVIFHLEPIELLPNQEIKMELKSKAENEKIIEEIRQELSSNLPPKRGRPPKHKKPSYDVGMLKGCNFQDEYCTKV